MMFFKNIDQLFDSLSEKIDSKTPLSKGAYPGDPLSQDHFLLKKSWNYFKERIQSLESQFEMQMESKRQEIDALQKEMQVYKEKAADLESKNNFLSAFQESFVKARHIDFVDFQKSQERLREVWEEERGKLEQKTFSLEADLEKQKKSFVDAEHTFRGREKTLQKAIDDLKNRLFLKAQDENEKMRDLTQGMMAKEEEIRNRDLKIDLLKEELGRSHEINHKLKEEIVLWEKRADSLILKVEDLVRSLELETQKNDRLAFKVDTLEKEEQEIRQNWQKEEAAWREMWDRFQSLREIKKT